MKQFDTEFEDMPMSDDHKPTYIKEQHNTNCQQFFGPITNCTFTMPSATPQTQSKGSSTRKSSKSQKPKITSGTYRYRWIDKDGSRIATLFQYLLKTNMIAKDTLPDDFMDIFSGKASTARVKWIAPQSYLWYMLREMDSKKYITMDESIWMIASSHFLNKDGRLFDNVSFSKQKQPKKATSALDHLVELLNVKTSISAPDIMDDDPDAELWAGIKDKGWEMNDVE